MGRDEPIDFKNLNQRDMLILLMERQAVTHRKLEDIELKFDGEISVIHKKIDDDRKNTVMLQISDERKNVKWMFLIGGVMFALTVIGNLIVRFLTLNI